LAKHSLDTGAVSDRVQIELIRAKQALHDRICVVIQTIVSVAASALPIWALQPIFEDLAGKDTNVSLVSSISVGINIAIVAGAAGVRKKMKWSKEELERQRGDIQNLEVENEKLRNQLETARRGKGK
jgi:hypothetical protein